RAWIGAVWFALATGTNLFTGRLTFAVGVAVALSALLAAQRGRRALALVLASGSSVASPVAGLFLALGAIAYALGQWRPPRRLPFHRHADGWKRVPAGDAVRRAAARLCAVAAAHAAAARSRAAAALLAVEGPVHGREQGDRRQIHARVVLRPATGLSEGQAVL